MFLFLGQESLDSSRRHGEEQSAHNTESQGKKTKKSEFFTPLSSSPPNPLKAAGDFLHLADTENELESA